MIDKRHAQFQRQDDLTDLQSVTVIVGINESLFQQRKRNQRMSNEPYATTKNLSDVPVEWHYIRQEAMLVRHLIGDGVTALGRAYYGEKGMGQYYLSFFSLSVGLERLMKLIVVADKAIDCSGPLLADDWVSKFQHKLVKLIKHTDHISKSRKLQLTYPRPNNEIANAIIYNFDAFADAQFGRYSNYKCIQNKSSHNDDPIKKWWNEVGELILKNYYHNKGDKYHAERIARNITHAIGSGTNLVIYDENKNILPDDSSIIIWLIKVRIVQKWARYHTLSIVRWISNVYTELLKNSSYHEHQKIFDESWNFFNDFMVEDSYLKRKEIWL